MDGSGAVAAEGAGMLSTHLALITIFQRKLDCWRAHSIYIFRVYSKHLDKEMRCFFILTE